MLRVIDYWQPSGNGGCWNVDLRRNLNDWEVEEMGTLIGMIDPISLRPDIKDRLIWNFSKDGTFSVKSCRESQWFGLPFGVVWKLL